MKKKIFHLLLLVSASTLTFSQQPLEARSHYHKAAAALPSEAEISAMEEKLVGLINAQREKKGLGPLRIWNVLGKIAREHSKNMADDKVAFGHDGFHDRVKKVRDQAKHVSVGENVAYNYGYKDPLTKATEGWMESKGHRENILGEYDETGIGIAYSKDGRCYLTQLFAQRQRKH